MFYYVYALLCCVDIITFISIVTPVFFWFIHTFSNFICASPYSLTEINIFFCDFTTIEEYTCKVLLPIFVKNFNEGIMIWWKMIFWNFAAFPLGLFYIHFNHYTAIIVCLNYLKLLRLTLNHFYIVNLYLRVGFFIHCLHFKKSKKILIFYEFGSLLLISDLCLKLCSLNFIAKCLQPICLNSSYVNSNLQ